MLVVYADDSVAEVGDLGLVHAPCLAMIERSALVTTAFTVEGKQVMHVRPAYRSQVDTEDGVPPTIDQVVLSAAKHVDDNKVFWHGWEKRFDYVYVLFHRRGSGKSGARPASKLIHDGAGFQLYKVVKPS